jgi:hypothetical protein
MFNLITHYITYEYTHNETLHDTPIILTFSMFPLKMTY